eukprot:7272929-Prymnesium_polylepis.1
MKTFLKGPPVRPRFWSTHQPSGNPSSGTAPSSFASGVCASSPSCVPSPWGMRRGRFGDGAATAGRASPLSAAVIASPTFLGCLRAGAAATTGAGAMTAAGAAMA